MLPGSENTTTKTPPNPITRPAARRRVSGSARTSRAITATKNGDELASTAATAPPARAVPTLMPTCVSVVLPNPIADEPSALVSPGAFRWAVEESNLQPWDKSRPFAGLLRQIQASECS